MLFVLALDSDIYGGCLGGISAESRQQVYQ